jgi:hypothetical protein
MTSATSTTFRVEPLHPSRLLCEACGEVACELPAAGADTAGAQRDQTEGLTAQQAALAWPEHAEAIREHGVWCVWRCHPPRGDVGVYVHVTQRGVG